VLEKEGQAGNGGDDTGAVAVQMSSPSTVAAKQVVCGCKRWLTLWMVVLAAFLPN